ncbi:MAG: PIG-L family deacetylase [Anaerolineales bacterium]|nr:PIG-L family deacetylase [Anaerolineales bacterium]
MRWIYVSPHLDDAVLSCGGLICEQVLAGSPVEIWTILSGYPPPGFRSPLAQKVEAEWELPGSDGLALRREEDRRSARLLGAVSVQLDFLDAIYRCSADGQPLYADIFVPPNPAEADLPGRIAASLSGRMADSDQLVCPLAIGRHVDHVQVRRAVESLGRKLFYYADIPYLLWHPEQLEPAVEKLTQQAFSVSAASLEVWLEAIAAHKSQMEVLFGGEGDMRITIREYWQYRKNVLLWVGQKS